MLASDSRELTCTDEWWEEQRASPDFSSSVSESRRGQSVLGGGGLHGDSAKKRLKGPRIRFRAVYHTLLAISSAWVCLEVGRGTTWRWELPVQCERENVMPFETLLRDQEFFNSHISTEFKG